MADVIKYETPHGQVELSPETVRRYLVNGNGNVTDQEIMLFLQLCKYQKLNPFIREAYLIKYGTEAATIVVGKDVFTRRATMIPDFQGFEAGVVVQKKDGIEYRKGTLVLPGEELVGGWAKVYRKNWSVPLETTVSLKEYVRHKKDGQVMSNWQKMPATMIRKVALVQALREAFPTDFQGLYSEEEMPVDSCELKREPVVVVPEPPANPGEPPAAEPAPPEPPAAEPALSTAVEPAPSEPQCEEYTVVVLEVKNGAALVMDIVSEREYDMIGAEVELHQVYRVQGVLQGDVLRATAAHPLSSPADDVYKGVKALTGAVPFSGTTADGQSLDGLVVKGRYDGRELFFVGPSLANLTKGKTYDITVSKTVDVLNKNGQGTTTVYVAVGVVESMQAA